MPSMDSQVMSWRRRLLVPCDFLTGVSEVLIAEQGLCSREAVEVGIIVRAAIGQRA